MRKGQSGLEYAVVITCVVVALIAMRAYITRGMQGRLRQAADELGQPYDPRHTSSDITTQQGGLTIVSSGTETNTETSPATTTTTSTTNIVWERERQYGDETVGNLP